MEAMKPSEALRAAKNLILDPNHWIQHFWTVGDRMCAGEAMQRIFRPVYGVTTQAGESHERDTCKWCKMLKAWPYMNAALTARKGDIGGLSSFNDSHSHAEIMALFDDAIAKAEAAGE